jgi:protein gp37
MNNPRYENGFNLTLHHDLLDLPLRWRKPKRIFVNSMSDLFHDSVPEEFIRKVLLTAENTPWHSYQILTKRAQRLARIAPRLPWPENVWQGVSIESDDYVSRVSHLRQVPAVVRFLSIEPLLGPIKNLSLEGIDWVIVGGESGPRARPMHPDWVRSLRNLCSKERVPFFFKQWGGFFPKAGGRELDGREWNEMPKTNSSVLVCG